MSSVTWHDNVGQDGYPEDGLGRPNPIWMPNRLDDLSFSYRWSRAGGFACEMGLKMTMPTLKAAPRIGCIRTEYGQVARAMHDRGGGTLRYLRWGDNVRRAFGRRDEGVWAGRGGCIHCGTRATRRRVTV